MRWSASRFILSLLSRVSFLTLVYGSCDQLESEFSLFTLEDLLRNSAVRAVGTRNTPGADIPTCLCRETPCSTPRYALLGDSKSTNNVSLIFSPGVHELDEGLPILNSNYIALVGVGDFPHDTVIGCGNLDEDDYDNCRLKHIDIHNSTHVYIVGITFDKCHPFIAGIHVQNSEHIVFENCTFRNNPGSAVHLYNVRNVVFRNCTFEDNIQGFPTEKFMKFFPKCYPGQNEQIFFLDSRPAAGALSAYSNIVSLHLLVTDCTFKNNMARPNKDNTLPRALLSFGHGGAMTLRLVSTSNSLICIKDSEFINNTAEANGGAIQLSMVNNAVYNTAIVRNCQFVENKCTLDTCTGGVIGIDFFQNEAFNEVHVIDSKFTNNWADAGGVVSLVTSTSIHQDEDDLAKPMLFKNCSFEGNVARGDGTVVSLFSATLVVEVGFPVYFEDCVFKSNMGQQINTTTAALSGYRVLVNFNGTNQFIDNLGGGVVVSESRVNVMGTLVMNGNYAVNGGGLAMFGRCLLVLFEGSYLEFINNRALRNGGGIYAEYTISDFIFSILNRGCFLQYSSDHDVPLSEWGTQVIFRENSAGRAGAAIFASDFTRCTWYGDKRDVDFPNQPFFVPVDGYKSPFVYSNNTIDRQLNNNVTRIALGTDPYNIEITSELESVDNKTVIYSNGEQVTFKITTLDQFGNFREGVFVAEGPIVNEPIGAVSANETPHIYSIPSKDELSNATSAKTNVNVRFQVRSSSSLVVPANINITVGDCHPGYMLSQSQQTCQCCSNLRRIVRCDLRNRYFYVREGYFVLVDENITSSQCQVLFQAAIPGFLSCTQDGNLPGCLFMFDNLTSQCATGRKGILCSQCKDGYGVSLDLRNCLRYCGPWGITLFVAVCIATVIFSFCLLYFDIQIPNPLKGVIFFAQVIGLIYRNSYYLGGRISTEDRFLQFLVNFFGVSIPFPACLYINAPPILVAWLGIVPPFLAFITAIVYIMLAGRIKLLSKRSTGLHGFQFICLFVYKYFLDTGFTLVNCRNIGNSWVFAFSGESCYTPHLLISFIAGILLIIAFAFVIPVVLLVFIYKPQKYLHLHDAFTRGIKNKRRYIWYGVWDIWRRVLFLAANLPYATASLIVVVDALLVFLVLTVHCTVKPYKKSYINVTEALVLFCLFGATIAILDENDIYIGRTVSIVFILIPFIYGVLYLLYKLMKKIFLGKIMKKYQMKEMVSNKVRRAQDQLMSEGSTSRVDTTGPKKETTEYWTTSFREPLIEENSGINS